jgi:class 3 adenylate cyclase/tetratricopeptide (TPR) repeat protein
VPLVGRTGRQHGSGPAWHLGEDSTLGPRTEERRLCSVAICPHCGEENSQRARFCQACATPLQADLTSEVRKTVTVLFSDVVGSTELADRLDTESFTRLLNRYFQEMKGIAERHGGTVAKFIGDAVVAVFGIPLLHEDDALRAVKAAWEMRSALGPLNEGFQSRWGVSLATRTGVNSGEVLTGTSEEADVVDGTIPGGHIAIGDAMNLGARVEQAADPGEILLGEATYRLVRDAIDAKPLPPRVLKGKTEAARLYRLLQISAGPDAITRRLDSPMVGRRDDVATLEWAFARTTGDKSCRLVTILGPAGVGKSRLVREFLAGASEAGTSLRGRCLPYGEGITFRPLAEVVKSAAGISDEDTGDLAVGKIAALLAGAEDAGNVAELVGHAIGLSTNPGTAQETFWSIRRLFENLARDRPLIVVFDDVHWAERTFLDLVEDIAEWVQDVPLLLICSARPEFLDTRPDWTEAKRYKATTISLIPLAEGECERLLLNLPGGIELGPKGRDLVVDASGGNPLFLEQMLSMLVDDGLLENARLGSTVDVAAISAPPTIQALLAARLDRLSREERQVIERAAVQGRVFYRDALSDHAEGDGSALSASLLALIRKQLISSARSDLAEQEAFRFVHGLVRDAAYQGIPKERRAGLHEAFAGWLEGVAGDRVLEYEEILAYHLEQGYLYRAQLGTVDEHARTLAATAAQRMGTAAGRALARGDAPGAENLLTRATALLPSSDPRQPTLLLTLAEALAGTGELEREGAVLQEAMDLATALGDHRLQAHVRMARARQRSVVDPAASLEDVSREADLAIPIFEEEHDHLGLATAWRLRNWVAHQLYRHAEALEARERAYEYAHRAGDPSEIGDLSAMAASIIYGPTPVQEGIRRCETILERVKGSRGSEGFVLGFLGILHAMDGRSDQGRQLVRRAAAIEQELGLQLVGAATRSYWMGILELLDGDPAAAEGEFRQGFEVLDRMGEQNFRSTIAARLAGVLCALGRYDEAERFAQISRETAGPEDIASQVVWRGAQAKVHARRGEAQQGEALASEAVALANRTDALNLRADALMDLADVQRTGGRRAQAVASLRQALGLYEQKGNVVSVNTTRAALKELEA